MKKKRLIVSVCLTGKARILYEYLFEKNKNRFGWASQLFQGLLLDKFESNPDKQLIIQQIIVNSDKQKELDNQIKKLMLENIELNAFLEDLNNK